MKKKYIPIEELNQNDPNCMYVEVDLRKNEKGVIPSIYYVKKEERDHAVGEVYRVIYNAFRRREHEDGRIDIIMHGSKTEVIEDKKTIDAVVKALMEKILVL